MTAAHHAGRHVAHGGIGISPPGYKHFTCLAGAPSSISNSLGAGLDL